MVSHLSGITAPAGARQAGGGAHIAVRGVSHAFARSDGPLLPVLDDVSLDIRPGEFVALLGPSGCGKSTLLRLVAGLEPPRAGALTHDGVPIARPQPSRVVVFQDPTLFPWRTVWDNVALGPQARGTLARQRQRVDAALARVGLSEFAGSYPHQLSGGMAQRVALARALVNDPQLLILDEPLGKLDSLTRLAMQAELVALWQRGAADQAAARPAAEPAAADAPDAPDAPAVAPAGGLSVLMVTHDVEEALFMAQRVIVMGPRPARIVAELAVDLPYPRHRGDPALAGLRRQALQHLGLDASW